MKCPKCGSAEELKVTDTRYSTHKNAIKRRRICLKCGYRFSTLETVIQENLWVIKRDGRKEKFELSKVQRGIEQAAEKRPVDEQRLRGIVQTIYEQILTVCENEITSEQVGKIVLEVLKKEDAVVYLRFASVYKEFSDIRDWQEEINHLTK